MDYFWLEDFLINTFQVYLIVTNAKSTKNANIEWFNRVRVISVEKDRGCAFKCVKLPHKKIKFVECDGIFWTLASETVT